MMGVLEMGKGEWAVIRFAGRWREWREMGLAPWPKQKCRFLASFHPLSQQIPGNMIEAIIESVMVVITYRHIAMA